jgi:redox-sensing transcriptional repressor
VIPSEGQKLILVTKYGPKGDSEITKRYVFMSLSTKVAVDLRNSYKHHLPDPLPHFVAERETKLRAWQFEPHFQSHPPEHSELIQPAVFTISRLLKKDSPEIPRKTIYRLSVYLRCLARLKDNNIQTVSSEALAKVAGVKPTQLRKDLAYFGHFGTRGLGYDVTELSKMISDELGTTSLQPVILVGVGNLGLALLSYRGFEKEGFEIVAAFDAEPKRRRDKQIKQSIVGMDELKEFVQKNGVKMAILTVPAIAAQEVVNTLVQAGIVGILNFSPIVVSVPEEVMVNNVNVAIELENLSYFIQD